MTDRMLQFWQIAIQSKHRRESIPFNTPLKMTNKTNWPGDEQAREALAVAEDSAEDAFRAGEKYLRENPIPILLLAVVVGAILGALLRPAPRKNPDPVQAVREWFEKAFQDFVARLPAAEKQIRSLQEDVIDRAEGLRKKLRVRCR